MLVPSPVILEHFVFPYDMASPSSAVNLAALNNFETKFNRFILFV